MGKLTGKKAHFLGGIGGRERIRLGRKVGEGGVARGFSC
jgi:hypothetical protein